jgi:hypothetical protein
MDRVLCPFRTPRHRQRAGEKLLPVLAVDTFKRVTERYHLVPSNDSAGLPWFSAAASPSPPYMTLIYDDFMQKIRRCGRKCTFGARDTVPTLVY